MKNTLNFNIQSDNYNTKKISVEIKRINEFLKDNDIAPFDFMTSIFSLYLPRIDNTRGCLLKTGVKPNVDTLLKIPYHKNISFMAHLNQVIANHTDAIDHTKMDIENYIGETVSYYAIYDFKDVNRDIGS